MPEAIAKEPLAEIVCTASGRALSGPQGKLDAGHEARWIQAVLAREGVALDEIDMVLSGANGFTPIDTQYRAVVSALEVQIGRPVRHGAYKHLCGEFHAASAFGAAMAVGLVAGRVNPSALLAPNGDCRTVLLYTLSETGTRAITCLRRPERKV